VTITAYWLPVSAPQSVLEALRDAAPTVVPPFPTWRGRVQSGWEGSVRVEAAELGGLLVDHGLELDDCLLVETLRQD
jgi:hypothetical protein